MILSDMHVHSTFSVDAKDDMESMCKAAISKGLNYICFTEHFDMNPRDYGYGYFDYNKFTETIDNMKRMFGNKINILKGLEFSEPHRYPREFEGMLKKDFDVIIGAVHWLSNNFVGESVLENRYTKEQIFEFYYKEVLKAVKFGGFDVLAHFDFPKRYLKISYDSGALSNEILKQMIKSEIALEINTSPLRKGLPESTPDFNILARYIELGGNKITIGSDAHSVLEIGEDYMHAYNLMKKVSKGKIGVYKQHRFIPIEKEYL